MALGAVVASCDASKALRPGEQKKVEMEFAGDSTIVVGSTVPVQFTVTVDGKAYGFPRLEIASSDTSVVALAGDGRSLVAKRRGHAVVTARFISAVLPTPPAVEQVVYVVAKSVQAERGAVTLTSFGDTAKLVVRALDANDEPIPGLAPKWISKDTAVAVVGPDGVVTARGNGTVEIGAVVDFDTVATAVTVQQRLARFVFPQSAVTIDALGAEARLEVTGLDARGNAIRTVSGAGAVWDVADGRIVSVTPAGAALAITNGETWARASAVGGAVRDSVRLVVAQRAAKVVVTTPGPLTLAAIGQQQKIEAHAFDRLDRPVANKIPLWVSRNPRVAYVDTLTAQAKAIDTGSTWILAQLDAAADSIAVRVTNAPARVTLDVHARTLSSIGDTLRLAAKTENAEQAPIPGWPLAWHSTDSAVVRVLGDGRAVATGAGVARVVVAAVGSEVADTAVITVTNAVARLDVVPSSLVLESINDTLVVPVVLENARGLAITDRAAVQWKSDEPDVVRVTTTGVVIALRAGSSMVRAIGPDGSGVKDSVAVVVTNAPASLVLASHADTITAVGKNRTYPYELRNRRGALILGYPVEWTSRQPTVVKVLPDGGMVAAGEGVTWVVARAGMVADSVQVTVGNIPTSLDLDRDAVTMTSVGDTLVLRATARNEIGVAVPSVPLTWHTPDSSVVRLDPARPGAVVARAPGTTLVIASFGSIADTTVVTVVNAAARVDIIPTDTLITSVADTARPAVDIYTTRGVALPRTSVVWESDDPVVARVTAAGEIIARDTGSAYVRARSAVFATVRDSILVVVRNVPAALVLAEQRVSITAVGRTYTAVAEVRNARGAAVSAPVTWRSTAPDVASVSSTGVVKAVAAGAAAVIAQAGAVADTVQITVLDVPVTVELTPPSLTATSVGDTVQLRAVVRNELGAEIVGAAVTYSTPNVTVVKVLPDGRVVTLSPSTASVIASAGSVADTSVIVVINVITAVDIVPTAVTLASVGDTISPAATARNGRGADIGRAALSWSSDDPAVATVSASGVVTARGAGRTTVRAVSPQLSDRKDSVIVTVTNAPASLVLAAGTMARLTAIGREVASGVEVRNAAGALLPNAPVSWRSTDGAVASVNVFGSIHALGVGTTLVIAQSGTVADTLQVTVTNDAVALDLQPATATMSSVGDTVQLRAIGRNDLGNEIAGFAPAWRTPDPSFVTVLADGRVVGLATGQARVIASWGALVDTTLVTVTNVVDRVDITPTAVTLASVNDSIAPPASVTNARGAELGRFAAVWASDDPLVARVTAGGLVIARAAGQTVVRASSPTLLGRTDSVVVTVTNAPATLVLNTHVDSIVAVSQTRIYTVEMRNARGALLTDAVPVWRSTTPAAATVTQAGKVTATGVGTTMIIAQSGEIADTLRLAVYDRPCTVVTLPSSVTLASVSDTVRVNGYVWNLLNLPVGGATPTWRSTDIYVAQVLADGRVVAIGPGTARVIASYGTLADTTDVTVTNAVVSVNILPATATLTSINDSTTPDLDVRNARGTLLQRTDVAWTSDDPAIARVSAYGTITAKDVGRTVVRAASPTTPSVRDSIVVTVSNDAASLQIDGATAPDTLTGAGQTLAYTATARNRAGAALAASAVTWRSTNPAVATVSSSGVVTATSYGTTLVIAAANAVADTAVITVINPTRLFVDNGSVVTLRVGTAARPFARIQDAVNTADAGDTVVVRPGAGVYSEAVTLGRRITLLGDSTAFVAAGRDPLRLPRISHDLGSAGVVANTPGASFVIRYLSVTNTVDGDAVAVLGASNVVVEYVYVNPGTPEFRSGSGIAVEGITGSALVARSVVQSVVGYGVRLRNVQNGRVDGVTVKDVGANASAPGAGVQIVRGANNRVVSTTVRRTDGPQMAIDSTSTAVVTGNDLAGEQVLMRLLSASGSTTIDGNAFDLRRQAGDAAPVGPSVGRAGLTVSASSGVAISNNSFTDLSGGSSQIDAVRLSDARPTGGAAVAVTLATNRFNGSRHAVHSERSTWTMTGSRVDNASVAVFATESDSISLVADTLATTIAGCVQSSGASSLVDAVRSAFIECSTDGTGAFSATGAGAVVDVDSSAFVGANQRALVATQARFVSMRGNSLSGAGMLSLAAAQRTVGAVDVAATDSIRFVGNDVREYRAYAAASLRATTVRADSNFVSRNLVGVRLGSAVTALVRDNSFIDNDALATTLNRGALGLANDGFVALTIGSNWWGDDRGPQRTANALAVGDSATGLGMPPATFAAAPILAHQGVGAPASIRLVRGDSQSVRRNTALGKRLTVRVVDAVGRPLGTSAGTVTFAVVSGGGTLTGATNGVLTVAPNASGLAEATFTAPNVTGTCKVSATVGTQSITFTVTSTP